MFAGEDEETGHGLSDYELERIAHIRRNREIMRRLGLGMHDIVTAARQRCGHDVDGEDDTSKSEKKKMKKATGRRRARRGLPARNSRRASSASSVARGASRKNPRTRPSTASLRTPRSGASVAAPTPSSSTARTRRRLRRTDCATRAYKSASPWWAPPVINTR